jgi:hypothetical protein
MTLLIIKEVTVYLVTKYRTLLLLLDLDHLLLLLFFFWRLNPVCIDL